MLDYLLSSTIKFLSFFVSFIPIRISLFFAYCLGKVFYYLFPQKAKLAYLNLKLAFGDKLSLVERKRIVKELFCNLFMNVIEFLYFPYMDKNYIEKYIKISGEEKIKKIIERKKGLIFLTAHFGNWELSSIVAQIKGYPITVLARQQKPQRLNLLLNRYRSRLGAEVIMRGSETRELLNCLRRNRIVGILGDQKSGKGGILVEFFSRLAWTPVGAIKLSRYTGAGILPVFIIREKGPYHRIEILDELPIGESEESSLKQFHILLEDYVKRYPSQWLWFHRRWKGSPQKDIIILSDGKAGHLNQARALAKLTKEVIEERFKNLNIKKEIVKIREMEIKFRNILARFLVNFLGIFARESCRGCLRCLRFFLEKDSFSQLISLYGDVIISCGVNLSAINLFLAKENQAKSFIIMKSGFVPLKRFDLAVIPLHDRIKPFKNVMITQTALNLIDEETMKEGIENIQKEGYRIRKDKVKIGLLIGGNTKNYILTNEVMEKIVTELLKIAQELDAHLLVTTSRRTSKEIETLVKDRLLNNSFCPLLIIANEKNIEKAVPGILGLSDIVVVSGESISMVSEAVSSGKPVLVFMTKERIFKKDTKQKRFLENLRNKGYIDLVTPERIFERIRDLLNHPYKNRIFEEKELLYERIKKIIP